MDKLKPSGKSFDISKWEVWEAYRQVKANQGAPGVDGVTLEEFDKDLKDNLYKIWNRMSSGSYFPPPVKAVEIPKPHGGGTNPWHTDDCGQGRPDGGGPQAGGEGRTDLSSRFLRVPAAAVGSRRGGGMPGAVLEERLGDRFGYPEVLRFRGSLAHGQGGGGPRRCSVGGAVCQAVAVRAAALPDGTCDSATGVPRKGPRSRRCWPTCSCITRSICGWLGNTRHSV